MGEKMCNGYSDSWTQKIVRKYNLHTYGAVSKTRILDEQLDVKVEINLEEKVGGNE
jgi:hypothetical protein